MTGAAGDGSAGRSSEERQPSWRRRARLIVSVAGPLLIVALLVYLLASKGRQIEQAAERTTALQLISVTLLALATLVARTEAVVACLDAMGSRPRRSDIHAANSLTFLAALINHYVSSIVRGALMQRVDRERSPTIPQMIMVDTATTLIEGLVVGVLVVVSASALKLAWWVPVLIVAGCIGGVAASLAVRRRFAQRAIFRGLDVLAHSRKRAVVAGLMVFVVCAQVARTFIVLRAVQLHPSLLQAVATFVAAGIISSLFAGPGAGTAGGPLLVFGHTSLAASAAAGLILSITTLIAGIVYAGGGGPMFWWRLRQVYT